VKLAAADDIAAESTPAADVGRFSVTRTGSIDAALTVSLTVGGTASNAAGADFVEAPLAATVVIPAGAESVDIDVTPIDDVEVEGVETVEVALAAGDGYRVGNDSAAAVVIVDDDAIFLDLSVEDAFDLIDDMAGDPDFAILDVRTPAEFDSGHLEGAENVDFYAPDFLSRLDALPRRVTYLIYCRSGGRSGSAHDEMESLGFATVYNMLGGITAWTDAGYPTVTE
jgi:rhodanese-related sulfurtransferase